ncbi:MAG TPA: adenylosuccinate lyase, partial [Candidatus Omnitrophica bacterium]|nr:adenylosuccinate lyase [Candidatus Omnitrophota bacterium]
MIERYIPQKIGKIWQEEEKFKRFLKIETLFLEGLKKYKYKEIPPSLIKKLKKVKISLKEIKEIEKETHHDIVAFLKSISKQIGSRFNWLHYGLTSSDLLDTTLSWQIKDSTQIILKDLEKVLEEVKKKALIYKDTLCIGRTHGVHAEIYSFGLKFLYFYEDLKREYQLLKESLDYVAAGKISGAVGTFSYFSPQVEEYICKKIGIKNVPVSTQIVSRERFAYYLSLLSLIGSTLERFVTEIRHLHRTEVEEAKEPFYEKQKGSSAMPHKQNPVKCERICGLSRILRANMLASFENINLWHERDISHSSAERIIIPDSVIVLDYMLLLFLEIIKNLKVNPQKMLKNIELNRGLIYSQKLLLKLMQKGLSRIQAYDFVQDISLKVLNKNSTFKEEVLEDKRIKKYLKKEEIEEVFRPYSYLINID